jgi:hypothetical protein
MTIKPSSLFEAIRVPECPFPGLRPFEFHESDLFFGRDGQVERLITKLAEPRFLSVVGTSGSGKSSLVRAGLLPALVGGMMTGAKGKWRIAVMRPGNDPIGNLARALNHPDVFGSDDPENAAIQVHVAEATLRLGSRGLVEAVRQNAMPERENLLVVADQFEELFRFAREASRKSKEESDRYRNEAAAFVKLLLEARRQREVNIFVVLTMRSDFLGDCAQFWDLPEAVNEGQYLIPRLTRDQLREVITGPVSLGGREIAPRLVTQLLNDIGDDQDQLPVLQHLLMRVWNEWKEKRLDVEVEDGGETLRRPHYELHRGTPIDLCCYEAVGGMANALSRHADEAFKELADDRHRQIAEKMFKCLTEKGEDNREIRRPVTFGEICAVARIDEAEAIGDKVKNAIEHFRLPGRSFLMPPAGTPLDEESLIDISHESLIRGWQRLKEWVEEEARSARIYRRLAETAELKKEGKAGLWRDPDLQIALTWREQSKPNQVWAQRYHRDYGLAMSFLNQSVGARDAEILDKEKERKRGIRRTRFTASVFAFLFLVSLVALIFAIKQTARANALLEDVQLNADAAKDSAVKAEQERLAKEQAQQQQMDALTQSKEAKILRLAAEESAKDALTQKRIAEASQKKAQEEAGKALEQTRKTEAALEDRDKYLDQLRVEKRAAEKAKDVVTEALKGREKALEDLRNEKLAAEYARDTAEKALDSLKNEQQKYASIAAEQKTLLTSIEDASTAPPSSTGKLRLRLKNAYGELLDEQVDIDLRNQSGKGGSVSRIRADASKDIVISNLVAGAPKGIYQINITPSSYLPVTQFVSVKPNGISETTIMFALDPNKVGKVEFPKYEDLPTEAQTLLEVSKDVEGNEGKTGKDLYESLDDLRRAGLLNIIAKCKAASLEGQKPVLSYLRALRRIRGDRIVAVVGQDLRGAVKSSQSSQLFSEVSGSLIKPPAGFTPGGSFKTQDRDANLKLTFFTNEETWMADLSIDSGEGLARAFLIMRDKLTGRGTHPYEIQQLLVVQGIDPGYRLRR